MFQIKGHFTVVFSVWPLTPTLQKLKDSSTSNISKTYRLVNSVFSMQIFIPLRKKVTKMTCLVRREICSKLYEKPVFVSFMFDLS